MSHPSSWPVLTPAQLLYAILSLPPAEQDELFERLMGRVHWRIRPPRVRADRYSARDEEIRRRRQSGYTYGQLSRDYGLSRGRVFQICARGKSV